MKWYKINRRWPVIIVILGMIGLGVIVYGFYLGRGKNHRPPDPYYTITDLGALPGANLTEASAINARGEVVGDGMIHRHGMRAFLVTGGRMEALGRLGCWEADGINDRGQVVGTAATLTRKIHAFLYEHGKVTDLGTLPGDDMSDAFGINAHGQIVGESGAAPGSTRGFLENSGRMTALAPLPGGKSCYADRINDNGQIIGESDVDANNSHAFLYQRGTMTDLGILPKDTYSYATGINASGVIIGSSSGDRTGLFSVQTKPDGHMIAHWRPKYFASHAVIFHPGGITPIDLGTLGGNSTTACAINSQGQIVGCSNTSHNINHAVLFHLGSTDPTDLNTRISAADRARWVLTTATGINDSGQICGSGQVDGAEHAFLLTPVSPRR